MFNFRHATASTAESLQQRLVAILENHALDYDLAWTGSGKPFLTPRGTLVEAAAAAIRDVVGVTPEISCSGGTSDGRFIAAISRQVVELGPVNATIHQINERVNIAELDALAAIYRRLLERLLVEGAP